MLGLSKGLRETFKEGYSLSKLWADIWAGITVCIIAIPMTMAVAMSCKVQPEHGLYGAIIGGGLIALLGGSRLSVAGPVAELTVLIYPVVYQFGFSGLLLATFMAGVILFLMGLAKLGRVIEFIPHPVTTGFIAGTALVIGVLQLQDFFGLTIEVANKHFLDRVLGIWQARPSLEAGDTIIGCVTLLITILWNRLGIPIPGALIGLIGGSLLAWKFNNVDWGLTVKVIKNKFELGLPQKLPSLIFGWQHFDAELIRSLFSASFAIAMLCAIKALLCAVVIDGLRGGSKHDPNAELMAHGIANMVVPFFGGMTATSALSRSIANFRSGARSPIAAIVHSLTMLAVIYILAPYFSYLPLASLAALMLLAAWNIFDIEHCIQIIRIGSRSDVWVLLLCFILTVAIDMVVAVGVGMVLAALLFMKRMAGFTGGRWLLKPKYSKKFHNLPPGVMVYEVSGPLFFGAAEKAMSTLKEYTTGLKVVILNLQGVPTMDISGFVALKSTMESLWQKNIMVILLAVQAEPLAILERAGITSIPYRLELCADFDSCALLLQGILKPAIRS